MEKLPSFATPRLTDVFVERPVLAVVLALVIILLGVRAALELPVLEYPELESSSLQISTRFVGASAETVEGFITDPIERAAVTVPGVDYVDSTTTAGSSLVTVWLELNENSTDALAEMTARLDQIRFELPRDAEDPTIRVVRADRPYAAFYLDVTVGGAYGRAEVTDYLQRNVSPLISAIPGVQRVGLEGGRKPAMRIWLDHDRMSMLDVSAGDVQRALQRNNVISTLGRSKNSKQRMDLLGDTNMKSTEDFARLVVRDMGGTQVVLSDIARVELGQEEGSRNVRRDHDDAVFISVWPLPGANEIEIGDRLYEVIDEINQKIPPELKIEVGYDATVYMRAALRGIFITLGETVLLVGFVVVMMMGSIRAALVPLIAIPISILGALAAMSAVGFSLNLLTILAIVLSVGLVVDDAIVVVENVARFMREGKSRHEAALLSSRQLLNPIIGMTITLAAVYAPIGFLTGLTGALFKEFAFALSFAVIVSGVVAVTLSPGMSARLAPDGGRQEGFVAWVNRRFDRLRLTYAKALDKSLHLTPQILFFGVFFSLLSIPCFLFSKSELAPVEDQGMIDVIIESAPDATVEFTTTGMAEAVDFMNDLPGTFTMWQIINAEGGFGGQLFRPFDERPRSVHDLLPEAYVGLASVPMLKIFPNLPAPLPTSGNFAVEFVVVSSEEPADMLPYAQGLVATAMKSGKFLYADTDLRIDFPQARFKLKRDRIADLGMTLEDVSAELSTFLAGDYLNRFDYDGKAYQVIPMIETGGRNDPAAILDYLLKTPDGDFIPVSAVADIEIESVPRALRRFQQKTAFRVYGGLIPGITKEQGLRILEDAAASQLPADYTFDYAGESRQIRKSGNTMIGVLGVAIVFVFLVLAVQFNSFRDPLVVLLGSVPLTLAGALVITFTDLTTINMYSQIGLITLVGLVAKNGILITEFAGKLRELGQNKRDAIINAATTRLRPVLMTTGATVLGHFPLVLVTGAGAEARNSIGIVLVVGMLIGTLFTLFVLPSVYLVLGSDVHAAPNEAAGSEPDGLSPA